MHRCRMKIPKIKIKRWHWIAILAVVGIVLYFWHKSAATVGHATPDDAMAAGWAVFQRGITGWEEHGPNGEIIDHDTGWTG